MKYNKVGDPIISIAERNVYFALLRSRSRNRRREVKKESHLVDIVKRK